MADFALPQLDFSDEITGQNAFYDVVLNDLFVYSSEYNFSQKEIQSHSTDGLINGNIVEFKYPLNDLNSTLFQTIKYISKFFVRGGIALPRYSILIDLRKENIKAYVYDMKYYMDEITANNANGAASKKNSGFDIRNADFEFNLSNHEEYSSFLGQLCKKEFMPAQITEFNIVGWAEYYYKLTDNHNKNKKLDFLGDPNHNILGEIRLPKVLKGMIVPFEKSSNDDFKYIMDVLNDNQIQRDLGAFYTPTEYAKLGAEMVLNAISEGLNVDLNDVKDAVIDMRVNGKVFNGYKDIVIIDRAAGSGNLEDAFFTVADYLLPNIIVSTYERNEYNVLMSRLGGDVRYVIPPANSRDIFEGQLVKDANAMSQSYYENSEIMQYWYENSDDMNFDENGHITNKKINNVLHIVFENPPFAETQNIENQKLPSSEREIRAKNSWKKDWIVQQFKEFVSNENRIPGQASNDIANSFIWSGFEYFMTNPHDNFILYSPAKYWKFQQIIQNEIVESYILNRKNFHASQTTAMLLQRFKNNISVDQNSINSKIIEIDDLDNTRIVQGTFDVKKICAPFSKKGFDKRKFDDDKVFDKNSNEGIWVDRKSNDVYGRYGNSLLVPSKRISVNSTSNKNIIGYLRASGVTFEQEWSDTQLLSATAYNGHGFYLREDNFMEKLPLFAAGWLTAYLEPKNWYWNGTIYRNGDFLEKYKQDLRFQQRVLFFTTFELQNKIKSFVDHKGQLFFNELSYGKIKNKKDTLAKKEIDKIRYFSSLETRILRRWEMILDEIRDTENFNSDFSYGLYQVDQDLNTSYKDDRGKINFDYPDLNGDIKMMKTLVREYYITEVVPDLFKYEFVK